MTAKHKLYRRIKWRNVILLVLLISLMITWSNIAAFGGDAVQTENFRSFQQITVMPGDSLWKLIKENNPDYNGRMDKAIWKIQKLNGLTESTLRAGMTLMIPTDL